MISIRNLFIACVIAGVCGLQADTALAQSPSPIRAATQQESNRTDIKGVIADSFKLVMIEHLTRIAIQAKTRKELGGPFFSDYKRSVRWPGQWPDTDAIVMNYIGHPIHGAAAAFIYVEHSPKSRQPFGMNMEYFESRWRPVLASALYSLQFEVGPLSEASIGNVGMRPETTGWVDYVITPIGALALMFGEDAMDKVMEKIEARTDNRLARLVLRVAFGPSRAMSNVATGRAPWHRDGRPLDWK